MNVTGALTYRIADQVIDELDNGRLARHFLEVFGLLLLVPNDLNIRHIADDVVNVVIDSFIIESGADFVYILFEAHDGLGVHLNLSLDVFDDEQVGRTACRHDQRFAPDLDGHDPVALYVVKIELAEGVPVHLIRLYPAELQPIQPRPGH